jgi:superfamily II DNA/RNA helicase
MIKKALENLRINALNEMQHAALNAADKSDLILLAPTGSGKTYSFGTGINNGTIARTGNTNRTGF